ncbi:WXG100 family type VII secretion target [Erysipelotrichaceae bacterium RD49]|nr:WXG100 family type VII secretion target [Erysipelotrichaceae bacterium RD49]
MEGVFITSDMLDTTSGQVTALKTQMETLFEQIKQCIRSMSAFWDSPASKAALNQFETLAPVFPKYIQLVENYCTYLSQTATAYRENETALGAGA